MSKLSYEERKHINAFNRRMDYLETRIAKNKKINLPTSYDEVELNAIIWALAIVERWFGEDDRERD